MTKCEQINDLGITVNSAFTPSANVLTAANKVRGILSFIKRSFTCLTKEIFVPLYSALLRPHLEYANQANYPFPKQGHIPPRKNTTGWVKFLRDISYVDRLKRIKIAIPRKKKDKE